MNLTLPPSRTSRLLGPAIRRIAAAAMLVTALIVMADAALAFGPVANQSIGDQFPSPYRELIDRQRAAFNAGATLPDADGLTVAPKWLSDAYLNLQSKDRYTPIGVPLKSVALALDLVQRADSDEQAAFALGFLANIAGDLVSANFYVPKKLHELGTPLLATRTAAGLVEAMADLACGPAARTRALHTLRTRSPDLFEFIHATLAAKPWNARITLSQFMTDVALHELALELSLTVAAPGDRLSEWAGALERLVQGYAGGLVAARNYADVSEYLRLAAAVAVSLLEERQASPWLRHGFSLNNPYPMFAGQRHAPLREGQTDANLPDSLSTNPGLTLLDAWFADPTGLRVDTVPPSACASEPGAGAADPKKFTATIRVAAWRALNTKIALVIRQHRTLSEDRDVASAVHAIAWTAEDVRRGAVREFSVSFSFTEAGDGPWDKNSLLPHAQGYYVVARVVHGTGDAAPTAEQIRQGVTFFSSYAVLGLDAAGWDTYRTWPFSLRVTTAAKGNSARVDRDKYRDGKSNEPPRDPLSATLPADFAFRFPYARLSPAPQDFRLATADGRELTATIARATSSRRGAILLHSERGSRVEFADVTERLRDAGITVIAIDFRGSNASGSAQDQRDFAAQKPELFQSLVGDVAAAKQYLVDRAGVAADRVVIVGAGLGASVALRFVAAEAPADRTPGLVLMSPFLDKFGFDSLADAKRLAGRALYLTAAVRAPGEQTAAQAIRNAQPAPNAVTVEWFDLEAVLGHGARQFSKDSALADRMAAWTQNVLK